MWYACKTIVNSQYGVQSCIGYVIETVFLVSTRNTGTGTMRKWPTQVSTVVTNVGRELSLLKMAINMANADYLSFFLWNELEPRCQQRAAGSLELTEQQPLPTAAHRNEWNTAPVFVLITIKIKAENDHFSTWLLTEWWLCRRLIRSKPFWKLLGLILLTRINFNPSMD